MILIVSTPAVPPLQWPAIASLRPSATTVPTATAGASSLSHSASPCACQLWLPSYLRSRLRLPAAAASPATPAAGELPGFSEPCAGRTGPAWCTCQCARTISSDRWGLPHTTDRQPAAVPATAACVSAACSTGSTAGSLRGSSTSSSVWGAPGPAAAVLRAESAAAGA